MSHAPSRILQERLLSIMDRKHHKAWPSLTRPGLTRPQLLEHFRHEFLVYVRDFPVLVAASLGNVPPIESARLSLAENLYEEQTGGLSKTAPHPELFLRMMEGLGFARHEFDEDERVLHPAAIAYRRQLHDGARSSPWQGAVALLTIFVEGSVNERAELAGTYVRLHGEEAVSRHPMVAHYGCPPSAMTLTRAHAAVEGAHRAEAWRVILEHTNDAGEAAQAVENICARGLEGWLRYRDGVAERMGLD